MVAWTDKRRSDLRQALDLHFTQFPDSPMRAIIAAPDIQDRIVRFDEADAAALKSQRSYLSVGRAALWATMLGTVIGAIALLPIEELMEGWQRNVIGGLQAVALLCGFLAATFCPPSDKWMLARATAEAARADVFRTIVRAGAGPRELLGPALACFRDAHLDWQLAFFRKRSGELHRSLGRLALYRVTAYALRALVGFFAVLIVVNLAVTLGLLWPQLGMIEEWLQIEEAGRWQLAFGVMASGILAFTTARAFMDRSGENAERYRRVASEVDELKRVELPRAETAAAAGDVEVVLDFCEKVQSVLSAEHLAWLYGAGNEGRPLAS
jgi:hypothetical protein